MLRKLWFVLILFCLCAAAMAAPPPEIADCKVFKVWQFTKSAEGWRPGSNVGPFSVKNGVLSFTMTGPDPGIVNTSPGSADCSRYGRLGIKMRSSASGSNQVYFGTNKSTLGEGTVATCSLRGDGKYHFCEVDLSQLKTWTGKLTVLRIDPVNGTGEIGAKVDIEWIALYQVPARLRFGRPKVEGDWEGRWRTVSFSITNVGGQPTPSDLIVSVGLTKFRVEPIPPGHTREITAEVEASGTGYTAKVRAGRRTYFIASLMSDDAREPKVYGLPNSVPVQINSYAEPGGTPHINRARGRLDCGNAYGAASLSPLGVLVYRDREGVVRYDELLPDSVLADDSALRLSGKHKLDRGTAALRWTITANPKHGTPAEATRAEIICQFTVSQPVDILRFEGPRFNIPNTWTHALFPGLQYLEANESYTATQFVGPKLADQHIPHPYRIAVPLMAVETMEGIIGMSWDPLQQWAPGHPLPCAQFEPDEGLMTIFAPSIPDYVDENHEYATTPYTLKPGQKMTLKMSFFTESGKKITDVIPDYLASHPIKSVLDSGDVEKTVDTCFKAYAGTLYANGWKSHIGAHLPHVPNPVYASLVLGESLRKSSPDLARKCNIDPATQLTQYTGTPLDWFTEGAHAAADAAIAKQSPDGGFPYTVTAEMSKRIQGFKSMSGVDATTLGTVGETNSGLIARDLGGILDQAVRTGAKKYVDAGLLGLAKLNTFTVPRGAQTWEVHAHTPDVYAAALCVNANLASYHLTGDKKYLDYAGFWVRTGLPFIYTWVPPLGSAEHAGAAVSPPLTARAAVSPPLTKGGQGGVPSAVLTYDENGEGKNLLFAKPDEFYSDTHRHINPGASIAVFGTSFYVANWFGTPVQWCGLVWANSARAYTEFRPDPVLQSVADSVFASTAQEQFDKGFAAGTYPDSWNLVSNTVSTAFIAPDQIISYAYGRLGEKTPASVSTASFKGTNGNQSCLNTFARIEASSYEPADQSLRAKLKLFANQDAYSCITNTSSPARVEVDGTQLARADDLRAAPSGWFYDAEHNALHVKYRSQNRVADLKVSWR